jgi:hypothetical protein
MPKKTLKTLELQINGEKPLQAAESCDDFEILQAAEGDAAKLPGFKLTAYTGGKLPVSGWPHPVVVDLSGMKVRAKSIPVLIEHSSPLGHTNSVEINAGSIKVTGVQSHPGQAAGEVIAAGKNSFPWQVSIGAGVQKASFVDAGETVQVNGRTHTGPLYVARQSVLKEVSFVAMGADSQTSASVEARHFVTKDRSVNPKFKAWLEARSLNPETLEAGALTALEADWKALEAKEGDGDEKEVKASSKKPIVEAHGDDGASAQGDVLASERKVRGDEVRRVDAINRLSAKFPEINAQAIEEGWTPEKTELAVLKASAPKISHSKKDDGSDHSDLVIEAAFARTIGLPNRDTAYDEQVLEAADKRYRGGIALKELVAHFGARNGCEDGCRDEIGIARNLKAAFSTTEISSILSNVGNKSALSAFNAVEQNWRMICKIGSARDFKTVTKVSLQGDMTFKKIAPSGKIESGDLGNQVYTNKVDSYGRMMVLTREEMRNDDAGALADVFKKMGRGGALALNTSVWGCLSSSVTFSSGAVTTKGSAFKSNLSASTALTVAGLSTASGLFDAQVDPDGNPLGSEARFLVTAAVDKATAWQIVNSTLLVSGNTTAAGQNNPHAGKFEHVYSRYLTTSGTWYLLADPNDIAVVEVLFLDGQETPLVQSFETDPSQLGVVYRGVYDFGVSAVEKRGAVKATA